MSEHMAIKEWEIISYAVLNTYNVTFIVITFTLHRFFSYYHRSKLILPIGRSQHSDEFKVYISDKPTA